MEKRNKMDDNGLINSEEEYNKELKWFNDAIKIDFKRLTNPMLEYKNFLSNLERAERIGLFPKEYCDEITIKFNNGLKNPTIKARLSEYLKRKGLIK